MVDNKTYLCKYEKCNPLSARKGIWVSEPTYRDINTSLQRK